MVKTKDVKLEEKNNNDSELETMPVSPDKVKRKWYLPVIYIVLNILAVTLEVGTCRIFFPKESPYIYAANIISILILFLFCVFLGKELVGGKKGYKRKIYFNMAILTVIFLIVLNRYYENVVLLEIFPELDKLSDKKVIIFILAIIILLIIIFSCIWLIREYEAEQRFEHTKENDFTVSDKGNLGKDNGGIANTYVSIGVNAEPEKEYHVKENVEEESSKNERIDNGNKAGTVKGGPVSNFFHGCLVIGGVIASVVCSYYLLHNQVSEEFNKVGMVGTAAVVFYMAVVSVLLMLSVGLLLFIMRMLISIFGNIFGKEKYTFGYNQLYIISIIIYVVSTLLLYRFFPEMEKLYENFSSLNFLAAPLAFLFGLVFTILFVHTTFLILKSLQDKNSTIYLLGEKLLIEVLAIACQVIMTVLDFIKFIPDYFKTIYECIEYEDEET